MYIIPLHIVLIFILYLLLAAGCDAPLAGTNTETPDTNIGYANAGTFEYTCSPGYKYTGTAGGLTVTCTAGDPSPWSTAPTCDGKIYLIVLDFMRTFIDLVECRRYEINAMFYLLSVK